MATRKKKRLTGHGRPAAPAKLVGDPRPAAAEALAAAVAPPHYDPPARTAHCKAALKRSGFTQAMIDVHDNLRHHFRGPPAREAGRAADRTKHGPRNIIGTGLGMQYTNGRANGRFGPVVLVAAKAHADHVAKGFHVPPHEMVGGERVAVDVVQVGKPISHAVPFLPFEDQPRFGASIGRSGGQTGTYGARVVRKLQPDGKRPICALSNAHVLVLDADGNAAPVGPQTRIVYPGEAVALPDDQRDVGQLLTFAPLQLIEGDGPSPPNTVDAALAWTDPADLIAAFHSDFPFDPEPILPRLGMLVVKEGMRTGFTRGTIDHVEAEVNIGYRPEGAPPLTGTFVQQLGVRGIDGPFGDHGDSGSLVIGQDGDGVFHPVGLYYAGNSDFGWVHPIQDVIDALDIDHFHYFPDEATA